MKNPRKVMVIGAIIAFIGFALSIILDILFLIKFGVHYYPVNNIEYHSDQFCVAMVSIGAIIMIIAMVGLITEEAKELGDNKNNTPNNQRFKQN